MSKHSLTFHAVLAALAIAFAWWATHRDEAKDRSESSLVLLDAAQNSVESVSLQWPAGKSEVTRTAAGLVMHVDREVEAKKPPKDKKDAAADAGVPDEAKPAPVREDARFPAGKSVVTAIKGFEPLRSKRSLQSVDAARLTSMGLTTPQRTLTIQSKARTVVLEIGESAYGGQGRYARVRGSEQVHLLDNAVVSAFEGGADTLMEKRVVPHDLEDVVALDVRSADRKASFVQLEREQAKTRRFVRTTDQQTPVAEATALATKLLELKMGSLKQAVDVGSVVASFSVKTEREGAERVTLVEFAERSDGKGHVARHTVQAQNADVWVGEVSETQTKELLQELEAAW